MGKNKGLRNKRLRDFETFVLEGLKLYMRVDKRDNCSYTLHTRDYGVIDFYPKSDKLLFREDNRWISDGCVWICNNL